MLKLIITLLACGCVTEQSTGWHDIPGAVLTPVASEGVTNWTSVVTEAAEGWNTALENAGCPRPFVIGNNGHEVRGYTAQDWPHARGVSGWTYPDGIERIDVLGVLMDSDNYRIHVIQHELGHAMGLNHSDYPGIMKPTSFVPEELAKFVINDTDVEAACDLVSR